MPNNNERISNVLKKWGAFFAFDKKQFDEEKKEGIKYVSLGSGLICPEVNASLLIDEINKTAKEIKEDEKKALDERAKALKIDMLPVSERIHNRKILIGEALSRMNNYMDSEEVAESQRDIMKSSDTNVLHAIDSALRVIGYWYHDRPEVKEVYDDNINVINELRKEIEQLL